MNAAQERQLSWILIALAVGLACCLGLIYLAAPPKLPPLPAIAASRLPPHLAPVVFTPPPAEQFAAIWQHPLLNPQRRPEALASAQTRLDEYVLTGVILSPSLQLALVQQRNPPQAGLNPARDTPSQRSLRLALGASLPGSGWTLSRLEPRQVWFTGPQGERVLPLQVAVDSGHAVDQRRRAAAATQVGAVTTPDSGLESRRRAAFQQILQAMQHAVPAPAASAVSN